MFRTYVEKDTAKEETIAILGDIETTGLDAKSEEIVNLAVLGLNSKLQITFLKDWWGVPSIKYIPTAVSKKTGLTNLEVIVNSDGVNFLEHAQNIRDFLDSYKDCIFVGQNLKFGLSFLERICTDYNLDCQDVKFDSKLEIMDVYKSEFSGAKSLDMQMKTLGITPLKVISLMKLLTQMDFNRHSGVYDVLSSYLVLKALQKKKGVDTLDELYRVFK